MELPDSLMTFVLYEFQTSFKNIFPIELEAKVENQGNHVSFLDIGIKLKNCIFVFILFHKRDKFSFFVEWIFHLSSNIRSIIFFYSFIPC